MRQLDLIPLYILLFGVVCVIIKSIGDYKRHNVRVKAGYKSWESRKRIPWKGKHARS